jgi:hypothetical protein
VPCYNEQTLTLIESEVRPCMHYNTLSAALAPVQHWQEIDALSLYHVLEQLTDERHPRGKRYRLALILSLLIEGEAGRDDHADRDCRVGPLACRLAAPDVTWCAGAVSVRGDLQQCVAHRGR